MLPTCKWTHSAIGLACAVLAAAWAPPAAADAPCGDLDECRVLIEINASDGDIGFHVLADAEDWSRTVLINPRGRLLFAEGASGPLRRQGLTENFFESAEPVCEPGLAEEDDDEVVTLPTFLRRFPNGPYRFFSRRDNGEWLAGWTELTHYLPAAPAGIDVDERTISWENGTDLGECTTGLDQISSPAETPLAGFEVTIEPDTEDVISSYGLTLRVPPAPMGEVNQVTIPEDYLAALVTAFPDEEIPLKLEVGAVEARPNGSFGNQTFTEADGLVVCDGEDGLAVCEAEDEEE